MKLAIFGLSVSSSWGNGHATLWRGLCAALAKRGHQVVFFERDVPYYAAHRDLHELPGGKLILYSQWEEVLPHATRHLSDADVGIVTSYCPDGVAATDLILQSPVARKVFYDLDTPVTLERLANGESVEYLGPRGLADFDLVLSYTGGSTLAALRDILGARHVAPLYGSVDPAVHRPVLADERYHADLSYLGTYAADRQETLQRLFIEPARLAPKRTFRLAGSMYRNNFPWKPNIYFVEHLPPADHPAFYCSSRLTLNVTRGSMARAGFCPSGRLFEAAACGAAILSDSWEGLDRFFEPDREILIAPGTEAVLAALDRSPEDLQRIARAARQRALSEHTADVRAGELESLLAGQSASFSSGGTLTCGA